MTAGGSEFIMTQLSKKKKPKKKRSIDEQQTLGRSKRSRTRNPGSQNVCEKRQNREIREKGRLRIRGNLQKKKEKQKIGVKKNRLETLEESGSKSDLATAQKKESAEGEVTAYFRKKVSNASGKDSKRKV